MARQRIWTIMAVALSGLAGCAAPPPPATTLLGVSSPLGDGNVSTYAEVDASGAPKAIGVMFTAAALQNLPPGSDRHQCFDLNGDKKIDPATECIPSHERVLPLPSDVARRADTPFKWAMVNWNPQGHIPPGVYDVAHFDVHFMIEPIESIFSIGAGPCGPEHVRCDQFAIARTPLPANYVPASHIDVGAVVPAMGNHLVNVTGPEFKGEKFKRSWIFGAYDGRVTFYEEMLTRDYMLSRPSECAPIPQPDAVAVSGYYPTQSCVRYIPAKDAYTVSLEGFAMRQASPPGPPRAVPPLPPGPKPAGHRHG